MKNRYILIVLVATLVAFMTACTGPSKIKTLIIKGQGEDNIVWMTRSQAVQQILDDAGIFSTKLINTPPKGENMSGFSPVFSKYDLVVIDYEGDAWPEKTVAALKDFVITGGGVVRIHSKSDQGKPIPSSVTVSERHDFEVRMNINDNPIIKGLPVRWIHPEDLIVQGMPLNGDSLQVLATAFSDTTFAGSGKPEPVLLANKSGKGRIFWTLLGTPDNDENKALHCAGFIVTLQRGAEWAATGAVTQELPYDFPSAAGPVIRPDFKIVTLDEAFEKIGTYDISRSTKYYTCIQDRIRKAAGDKKMLLSIEKRMVKVLTNPDASVESKKLMLRELSWMGTDFSLPAIKELAAVPELKDEADFALTRLK
jgi:uncharacterized protein